MSRLMLAFLLATTVWGPALATCAEPQLRIGIVETVDPYCKARGLSEFLKAERVPFEDITESFRTKSPDLSRLDLLIVGSFVTADPAIRDTCQSSADAFRQFVSAGGVLAVLCQADQDSAGEAWIEAPRQLSRTDADAARATLLQPDHPLLKAPETITPRDLRDWRVPTTWKSPNTLWEMFSDWNEVAVLLGDSESESPTSAGLVEAGWGEGRAVFYAMAADKAVVVGNDAARAGGTKLLRNLLAYASRVRADAALPVRITPTAGYKHPVRGTVYIDEDADGRRDSSEPARAGIAVTDGYDVVLTDDAGGYRLENEEGKAVFSILHQPGDVKQNGQNFFHRLGSDDGPEQRFDFGLIPAGATQGATDAGSRFVQLTDSHVRNVSDRDYMRQATDEIYSMQPPPDFVVATGDLVDWGVDEHFQNYVAGMQKPPVPYFNVFGNHEIAFGPIERYHHYIGPDYYSFERGGVLFLALNCVTPGPRQNAWLERTLELLGRGRAVVVFQHFPPTPEELERFARLGVKSVFSGHWHSEKEMEHAGVQSVNSPTFIMGGIDASPAGFKIVHLSVDGRADTEWRYGFQKKRLTIVSPQQGEPVGDTYFPILVNAYDSATDVASVSWRLGSKDRPLATGVLHRDSAMSWSGVQNGVSASGSVPLRIEARDERGETWIAEQQVEAAADEPAPPRPSQDWPMFMGGPAHSGSASALTGRLPLRLAWSVDSGGDPDFASPILADGRLYLALKKRTRGRTNGVAAFDPVTGERLWLFETPMAINHTPAYAEGVLCVAEMGGRIHGLDAATGHELWHHDLIDDRGRYCYCAPAVEDGFFYAGVLRRVAKLRARDGHVEWEKPLGQTDSDWISSYGSPAVAGGMIAMTGQFGRGDSLVVARGDDGSALWGHPADGGVLGSPTIAGDRVLFCGHSSALYCRRLSDGQELWKQKLGEPESGPSWSATTPAVSRTENGREIVVAGSGDGHLSALDLADGKVLWTHVSDPTVFKVSPYRRDDRPLLSSPTIAGDKVFFGSTDGHLHGLDLASGEELWSFAFGVSVMSTPLVTGNAIYVAAYDGRLYAFTSADGEGE